MRRLHLRIYVAVVASLAVFALAAALLWLGFAESALGFTRVTALLQNVLSSPGASVTEQQTVLERALRGLDVDASVFAADGVPLASVGVRLRVPETEGWQGTVGGRPVWALRLPDGRWLAARMPRERRGPGAGLLALAMILVAVGVGTYPLVRGLTQRLERLQAAVESLGAGELLARVKVEGDDEVARLAESFNRAAARIEQLVGAHKSLLASASHELRTPLARIRMGVELTKDAAGPERKRELEKDIAELDEMIDEILLASRLDAMRELEAVEEVDLLALAAEECARYDEAELDGQPATVRGDPRLLRRLIRNLLENARRHGAPPIGVRVSGAPQGTAITVCDHGPGVPQAERDRVFEPFYRLAGPRSGAGIGLSLVREIARRHGGEARCEGNCFSVTLSRGVLS
jgi:two-component system, OmpR family, sensor histidine kinase RstB